MNYSWANLEVILPDVSINQSECFSPFRKTSDWAEQVIIDIKKVAQINFPETELSCSYGNLFYDVHIQDKKEMRVYKTGLGNRYALLVEKNENKNILFVQESYNFIKDEMALFNHLAMERTMYQHGIMMIHASFIKTTAGAILFTAPSGTGKSTQAGLWEKYIGSEIINGDRAAIWKSESGWWAGGVPWCGTSEITKNEIIPLKAIVILRQGRKNEIFNPRVVDKLKNLMQEITVNPWNNEMIAQTEHRILDLICEIPVYQLTCLPDYGAVELLAKTLGVLNG